VVAALDAGQREGRIWSALAVSQEALETVHAEHVVEEDQLAWDESRRGVVARRVRRLGALTFSENVSAPQDADAAQAVLLQELARRWPDGLPWNAATAQYRARIQRMAGLQPGAWPDVSDAALQADMAGWLGPWLGGRLRLAQLADLDLVACLQGLLDWQQQQQLDAWLPSHYTSPAGSRRRIDYLAEGPPRCAVPLQEVFGEADTPALAGGRLPLVLELLNPAGRPIQVTADLANFWAGAYTEVRKELRGRYPKHDWPEDPAAATARRGTGRRRRG
jgi:ATP-dependent helicase HrpB